MSAALDASARALTRRLLREHPASRPYDRAALAALPPPVARLLAADLDRHVDAAVPDAPWVDGAAPAVRDAVRQWREAAREAVRFPADAWAGAVERAARLALAHLVRPAETLAAYAFEGEEGPLPAAQALHRVEAFGPYPYLPDIAGRYVERKDLGQIDRPGLERLIRRIDQRMVSSFGAGDWADLFAPLVDLAGPDGTPRGTVPAALLRELAEAKDAPVLAAALDTPLPLSADDLRQRLADALGEPTPTSPAETTPAETTPAETTPAETTPAETTPAETTPAETTPADAAAQARTLEDGALEDVTLENDAVDGDPLEAGTGSDEPTAADEGAVVAGDEGDPSIFVTEDEPSPEAEPSPEPDGSPEPDRDVPEMRPAPPVTPPLRAPEAPPAHAPEELRPEEPRPDAPVIGSQYRPPADEPALDSDVIGAPRPASPRPAPPAPGLVFGESSPTEPPPPPAPVDEPAPSQTSEDEPLWRRFARDPETAAAQAEAGAGDAPPLWQRFLVDEPVPDVEPAAPLPTDPLGVLEGRVLGANPDDRREWFVGELFSGSATDYHRTLAALDEAQTWTAATQIIGRDVFRKHSVNIYSEPAVAFTDAVEAQMTARGTG